MIANARQWTVEATGLNRSWQRGLVRNSGGHTKVVPRNDTDMQRMRCHYTNDAKDAVPLHKRCKGCGATTQTIQTCKGCGATTPSYEYWQHRLLAHCAEASPPSSLPETNCTPAHYRIGLIQDLPAALFVPQIWANTGLQCW